MSIVFDREKPTKITCHGFPDVGNPAEQIGRLTVVLPTGSLSKSCTADCIRGRDPGQDR